ncbi:COBRA-like protein 7 [Nymphaea thermarum]|nr:COBRA-like protein 7 [Nymphaea thermarum]
MPKAMDPMAVLLLFGALVIGTLTPAGGQSTPATKSPKDSCIGIYLEYNFQWGQAVYPMVSDLAKQGYSFHSSLTLANTGVRRLNSWVAFIGFQHREYLVSADGAVLTNGTDLPADVGNGTFLSGFPVTDLKTAIETAGDTKQIEATIPLVGTEFGVLPTSFPMPANISLANDGYTCPKPTRQGNQTMYVCCIYDGKQNFNISNNVEFLPRQNGDLTFDYDVIQSYGSSYLAQVTMTNKNPLGRLDNWKLSWQWMRNEFIYSMRGAYTLVTDVSDCIYGPQGTYYKDLDFSKVMNCETKPTIVDLPLTRYNDTTVGLIQYCCRNGTLLPSSMDPSKSKSAFQLQVYKSPPDLNRTVLFPPQNWKVSGSLNPDYQCGPPVRVSPTLFPDPSGLQSSTAAIATWQVVCNITQAKNSSPRCCVSFSAYYNDSVVPCKTCACGCSASVGSTCSTTASAMLLPSEALLVPFANRTVKALAWADIKHFNVPNPMPCSDNCGVSINWHVLTDYSSGWTARITLFNWEGVNFADWFTAIELDKAFPGYEAVYSFNGTTTPDVNNTILMQGMPGLNYLMAEDATQNPPVPGKMQSVISFTKKKTPGINVPGGDGFPTKVFFNGEECSLPSILPTADASAVSSKSIYSSIMFAILAFMLLDQLR